MLERLQRLETYLTEVLGVASEDFTLAIERFNATADFSETELFEADGDQQAWLSVPSQHDFKIRKDYLLSIRLKNQLKVDVLIDNLLAWLYSEGLIPTLSGMLERNNQQTWDAFIDLELKELSRNNDEGRVVTC